MSPSEEALDMADYMLRKNANLMVDRIALGYLIDSYLEEKKAVLLYDE